MAAESRVLARSARVRRSWCDSRWLHLPGRSPSRPLHTARRWWVRKEEQTDEGTLADLGNADRIPACAADRVHGGAAGGEGGPRSRRRLELGGHAGDGRLPWDATYARADARRASGTVRRDACTDGLDDDRLRPDEPGDDGPRDDGVLTRSGRSPPGARRGRARGCLGPRPKRRTIPTGGELLGGSSPRRRRRIARRRSGTGPRRGSAGRGPRTPPPRPRAPPPVRGRRGTRAACGRSWSRRRAAPRAGVRARGSRRGRWVARPPEPAAG